MIKKIKILHIGDFRFDFYDESLFNEFKKSNSLSTDKLEICKYFHSYKYDNFLEKAYFSIQNRYKFGPVINKINSDILDKIKFDNYDLVFIWRGVHIKPETLIQIRNIKKNIVIFGYNNDSTFSRKHPAWLFYLLKRQIPYYDHFYSYKESDVLMYEKNGCASSIFLPTFDPSRTYPIKNAIKKFDVVFVGHYENDGRDILILNLIKLGLNVALHGQGWAKSTHYIELKDKLGDINPAYENYNEILNSGKIALNLLSKSNNDTYTRRSLEIPSTRTAMLAPLTSKHTEWFKPDLEAFYFKSYEEIPGLIIDLTNKPSKVNSVAEAGYKKVMSGEFQLAHRVNMVIKDYEIYEKK